MLNVHGGAWFIDDHYRLQARGFGAFVRRTARARLLVIDVGSGWNTPAVVRWPAEAIARGNPNAKLLRINVDDARVPADLGSRAVGLACGASELLVSLATSARR